jgi:hypothetical protein
MIFSLEGRFVSSGGHLTACCLRKGKKKGAKKYSLTFLGIAAEKENNWAVGHFF